MISNPLTFNFIKIDFGEIILTTKVILLILGRATLINLSVTELLSLRVMLL